MKPIPTWRERAGLREDYPLIFPTTVERCMQEEIDCLRARLLIYEPPVAPPAVDKRQLDIFNNLKGQQHEQSTNP